MVPAQRARAIAGCVIASLVAAPLHGQLQPEARVEAVRAEGGQVEAGAGLVWRMGAYLRSGVNASRDVWRSADTVSSATRAEYVMRFAMDPVGQQRWGLSVGGGLGYRRRVYLLAVADLEGPRKKGLRPAVQLALGGGVRLAFVLRRAATGRR